MSSASKAKPASSLKDVVSIAVAPDLAERVDYVVVREANETDTEYEQRCKLFALLMAPAK